MLKKKRMKLIRNSRKFPPLNVINGKTPPYGRKGVLRHYQYRDDPNLGQVVVAVRSVLCSLHDYQIQLSIPYVAKIKYSCNKKRYERVLNC